MSFASKKFRNRRSRKKPGEQIQIAKERIAILFSLAEKEFPKHPELSNRYVEIARKINMKFNVPIPGNLKKRFCKECKNYIVYGRNARVRLNSERKYVLITCLNCGNKMKYGYSKRKIIELPRALVSKPHTSPKVQG